MKRFFSFPIWFIVCFTIAFPAFGNQEPHSLGSTPHIKEIVYNPNGVHMYTGFFGYQSSIVFEDGEIIDTISMGDSTGWQLNTSGNRLFLKPIEDNATTNVTILTSKRVYHFVFTAKEARNVDDPDLAYEVRFRYTSHSISTQNSSSSGSKTQSKETTDVDIARKAYLNFEYELSGHDSIKPLKIFDDGRFTYMQFPTADGNLPAVFLVDSQGYEALINYHISGKYLVIQQVAPRFTLRHGNKYVCVFNMKSIKRNIKATGRTSKKKERAKRFRNG